MKMEKSNTLLDKVIAVKETELENKKNKKQSLIHDMVEREAIELVKGERTQWMDSLIFITPKVAFNIRNLIENLRRNYWGVYKTPVDATTNREKVWIPLTETVVDSRKAYTEVDEKDITFFAKKGNSIGFLPIIRAYIKNWMEKNFIGEELDKLRTNVAIDGSAVWKTLSYKDKGKWVVEQKDVDILNLYFDPTSKSLQEAYRVTERAVLTKSQINGMTDWDNREKVTTVKGLNPTSSGNYNTPVKEGAKSIDVWETWGAIPKWFFSGKLEDKESGEEVEGRIVVSGIETNNPIVHGIWKNDKNRPYEEAHSEKIAGRWLGRGPAEKVMMLQTWLNTVVNIRINRAFVAQLGLFKIKRGRGITPQTLSRLPVNGAVLVQEMDDIQQFVMEDVKVSAYKDENSIQNWAEKVTATYENVTGESVSPAQTATAAAIQSRSAMSRLSESKKNIGHFLRRWLKRQVIPNFKKMISKDEVLRITGDADNMRELDERVVNYMINKELKKKTDEGTLIDTAQVLVAREKALKKLKHMGNSRYVELVQEIPFEDIDIEVHVDNEQVDKTVLVDKLISILQLAPEYKPMILRKVLDIFGLNSYELESKTVPTPETAQPTQPTQQTGKTLQQLIQGAGSPQTNG